MEYNHRCIKCKEPYTDTEEDAYLCPKCVIDKNKIAKQIDAQFAGRDFNESSSELKAFEASAKVFKSGNREITFGRM